MQRGWLPESILNVMVKNVLLVKQRMIQLYNVFDQLMFVSRLQLCILSITCSFIHLNNNNKWDSRIPEGSRWCHQVSRLGQTSQQIINDSTVYKWIADSTYTALKVHRAVSLSGTDPCPLEYTVETIRWRYCMCASHMSRGFYLLYT